MSKSKRKRVTAKMRRARFLKRQANDLHTIESFCLANGISVAHYYVLRTRGDGPREMRVGRTVRISPEAEAEWRKAHEQQR